MSPAVFLLLIVLLGLGNVVIDAVDVKKYSPDWKSLDSRPLPPWYDEAKIGIFMHWGVFSVPSFRSEWFWEYWKGSRHQKDVIDFMKRNYPPNFTYGDFASQFSAEFYDPSHWAEIFEASGARYVVLTSKHHEGFTMWPSKHSFNWNAMDVGPQRDLVGELAQAVRNKTNIHFGLYHSLFEWFNPVYLEDKNNKFKTQDYVRSKALPELYELVHNYKPEVIWSDGDAGPPEYWNSTEFLAWLFNDSPVKDTVVVNDRWGTGCSCKHGSFYNCDDRYNPGVKQNHKWENAMTIDRSSWGYRRNAVLNDYLPIHDILQTMAETVSCGGNLLINIGPSKEGTIPVVFETRLREMGAWLKVNGDAIYGSVPWIHQNDTVTKGVWYTSKKSPLSGYDVYAIVLSWPDKGMVELGAVTPNANTNVTMLGYSTPLQWVKGPAGNMNVIFPLIPPNKMPSQWAWVLKIVGLDSF